MSELLPALNLIATLGWRRTTLEIARGIERRGFAGISVSSQYSNMAQCLGLAFATEGYHSPLRLRQSIRRPSTSSRTARPIFTRWPFSIRYWRRACAGRSTDGGHTRQTARRHPRLCRKVQIVRRRWNAASDRSCSIAQADGRARRRNRRRRGFRQCEPL